MPKIVLFGATGYTGRLCARALVERGLRPVLAARSEPKLKTLVGELGVELPTRLASSDDPASVAALLDEGDVMVTTVGPFSEHGAAAVQAAIDKRAQYIDSTGEPSFVRRIFTVEHERALGAGTLLLTAFGYDYVPGHLAAALALQAAGTAATRVDIGYFFVGRPSGGSSFSQGTERSLRIAALHPGLEWSGGRLIPRYGGVRERSFDVDGITLPAVSLASSEHYALPREFSQLREINAYLGWFGKRSHAMSQGARVLALVRELPLLGKLPALALRLAPQSHGEGPSAETRANMGSHIVAIAYDERGKELARIDLVGTNGYDFTAKIMAWGAEQVLGGNAVGQGARGPLEAFGLPALQAGCAQAGLSVRAPRD